MLMAYHALSPLSCPPVKIAIGHRLFASVLLAMLTVAAAAVLLLRQNVLGSFGDYAVAIELDRLDDLSGAVARLWRSRDDRYSETRTINTDGLQRGARRVEMSYIGG